MEESVTAGGCPTLTVTEPLKLPRVAVIFTLPSPIAVTSPLVETEAMELSGEAHVTSEDKLLVKPSEYMPLATICCVSP